MSGFARSRDRRPHMPSDTGKAPAFGGAGRGRLPMGKLRGHSPVWWKTPRAAGPSESAASTRSEGKGPKAGQFLTQPPVFLQQLTVFGVELMVFYGKLPALGAFLIQFLQHWRQPHPEEGYSFDCSRITPRPNSNHSGETSKMVHTLMINAKSGILAPRSYLPSVVSGVRRRVANSLCVMAPRTAFSRSCNDSIGSVHPKPAAPLLFSGRAHHRIVVSGSGRKIPFLIDNNPKMVNKGRGRLRNDVTTELYRTPTK